MATSISRQGLREVNCEQVLRTIVREGPLARIDLAHYTGLTTAAISNITRELIESGLLHEVGTSRSNRVGANSILLNLPEDAPLIGVVHQGVSALRIAICNLRGIVIGRRLIHTPGYYTPMWAVTAIARTLRELLQVHGHTEASLIGIGLGLVGLVDAKRGVVKRAPSLGWENVPLRDLLTEQLHLPIALENNVRAMAFGEALLGSGKDWSDFAFVYIGTGIGAGLIIDGRLHRGAHGNAGEIGHIIVESHGEQCACGNQGCVETIAAEPAIVRNARAQGIALGVPAESPKEAVQALVALALMQNEAAREVVCNCGESLGVALANLVDIFNPSRIVLHGAITRAGDIFFSSVQQCLRQHAFLTEDESVELAAPTFGDDAGLVGAAAIALDELVLSGGGGKIMGRMGPTMTAAL